MIVYRYQRINAITVACGYGNQSCISQAKIAYSRWMNNEPSVSIFCVILLLIIHIAQQYRGQDAQTTIRYTILNLLLFKLYFFGFKKQLSQVS